MNLWKRVATAGATVALGIMVACSGGGGDSNSGARRVALLDSSQITPWTSGSVGFRITPALTPGESMHCQIDDGPEVECGQDDSSGRVAYADLSVAEHVLAVKTGTTGAMKTATVPWRIVSPDVIVYGATPGGISAAIAAARAGRTVVLLEASPWIGGLMTGGLAKSDVGGTEEKPLGGITAEFFDRTRQRETATGACSTQYKCPIYYDFEPHVAGEVFQAMLAEQTLISVQKSMPITAVAHQGTKLLSVTTARGEISAKAFIDASYEGDLMVLAGVSHTTVREARQSVGDVEPGEIEDDAGFGTYLPPYGLAVDPYLVAGDSASGLIPFVEPAPSPTPAEGSADGRLMSYNYRLCVTDDPDNRVPFSRPSDYDSQLYEGSARVAVAMAAGGRTPLDELYFNPARTVRSTNRSYFKHDLNGGSAFSTDMSALGWNQAYPTSGATDRAAIAKAYRSYIAGLLHFWQTDPRFGALNAKLARFGLCKDEFTDNDHWPYALYVREARRMVGEYVMNENDLLQNGRRSAISDSIGMGAYSMDSHIRRITVAHLSIGGGTPRDVVVTEGFRLVRLPDFTPYPVSYRSLLPKRAEVQNLLNPVTLSATSMAYSSLRMEPTFMVLGQAAGTAAALAVEGGQAVQDVSVSTLQARLQKDGQILH